MLCTTRRAANTHALSARGDFWVLLASGRGGSAGSTGNSKSRVALGLGVPLSYGAASDPEAYPAVASRVAPAQSRREAGTRRGKGDRLSRGELPRGRGNFSPRDGAPGGVETPRTGRAASAVSDRESSGRFDHVGAASQDVLLGVSVPSDFKN